MNEMTFIEEWRNQLLTGGPGLHLADPAHPLQIFIGSTESGAPRMVIRTELKPQLPSLSHLVLIERYQDQSDKWNLVLTLQDRKFEEVFIRLADDVHARSANSPNEATALDRVSEVVDEWRRLLRTRPTGLLSMEELRGLVGELWMLLTAFRDGRSVQAAIEGWLGPMGLPQDFWYVEDGYHEVKAIGPSTVRVRISSEHQLDASDLELLVLKVANCSEGTSGAVNLPTLVTRVRGALSDEASAPDGFEERLARLGVDLAEAFYSDTWFVVSHLTSYSVDHQFPAIRASTLQAGVSRVTYQIALTDISEFVRNETKVQ